MSEKSFEITLPDHKSSESGTNLLRPDRTKEKVNEKDESFEKTISKKKSNEQLDKYPKVYVAESAIDNLAKNVAKFEDKPPKDTKIEQPERISATNEPSIKSSELTDKLGNDRASESTNENQVNKVGNENDKDKRVNFIGVPPIMDSKETRRSSTILIDRNVLLSNHLSTSAVKRHLIIFSVSVCFVAYVLLRLLRS